MTTPLYGRTSDSCPRSKRLRVFLTGAIRRFDILENACFYIILLDKENHIISLKINSHISVLNFILSLFTPLRNEFWMKISRPIIMHQSIPSTNIPPSEPMGFALYCSPGTGIYTWWPSPGAGFLHIHKITFSTVKKVYFYSIGIWIIPPCTL